MQKLTRQDKLYTLAKACKEKGVNPNKGNYAGTILQIAAAKLFISQKTAKELTQDLTLAYRYDRWEGILGTENQTEETATCTPNKIMLQLPRVNPLKNLTLTEPLQPVKTVQPKPIDPDAEKYLTQIITPAKPTEKQYAQIFYAKAERDILNGIGRITLSEAKEIMQDKTVTIEQIQELLQKYYVDLETETRGNILLIYYDGKSTVRSLRDLERIVQPKNPVYHPKDNPEGDIAEEDEGVVSEQAPSQGEG
jgi:uncharacterized membrane protein